MTPKGQGFSSRSLFDESFCTGVFRGGRGARMATLEIAPYGVKR